MVKVGVHVVGVVVNVCVQIEIGRVVLCGVAWTRYLLQSVSCCTPSYGTPFSFLLHM
jgi:hypothetical protein